MSEISRIDFEAYVSKARTFLDDRRKRHPGVDLLKIGKKIIRYVGEEIDPYDSDTIKVAQACDIATAIIGSYESRQPATSRELARDLLEQHRSYLDLAQSANATMMEERKKL